MSQFSRRDFNRIAAGAAGVAALGTPVFAQAQTRKVKVGMLLPRSGYLAKIGQSCQMGADISPTLIKQMYGVEIELMNADFESKVEVARARAEQLIDGGAQVLVGAFDSGASTAIAQVAEQRKVPFVINIAAAPKITKQGYKYVFRNFPTAPQLVTNGLALFRDLFQATGTAPRKAGFMHVNDTFGRAMTGGIKAILPHLNYLPFKIVEEIGYDPAARDLSVEVAKAKASGADFVMLVCRLNDAILLVREMVKQRYNPMGVVSPGSPGMYEQAFYESLGKYSEYCISNVPWYNPKAKITKMIEGEMKKQFPKENLLFHALNVGFTFEAMMIVGDAVKRAGGADSEALTTALRSTDIADRMMLGGPIKFSAEGQNNEIASACIQNLNRRPTVVLPAASAEHKPVFPMPGWGKV
ncbi:MAG TPA: ABC transporter substrate-binding protein [Burkholderiaceae bacterium]|nr:ABC transporter substrate-binding protein [Burkholderiaceae bacterium]